MIIFQSILIYLLSFNFMGVQNFTHKSKSVVHATHTRTLWKDYNYTNSQVSFKLYSKWKL